MGCMVKQRGEVRAEAGDGGWRRGKGFGSKKSQSCLS
jgi:hypothetical protein